MTYPAHATNEPLRPKNQSKAQGADPHDLHVNDVPEDALALNIEGREVHTPLKGFGQLWHKIYQLRFDDQGPAPELAIREWKEHFSEFWPPGNEMYAPLTGIQPGEVTIINLGVPGVVALSTGMYVANVTARSFTLLTPEGHILAGHITFSAFTGDDGHTVVQIAILMRAGDPLYELTLMAGGQRQEDRFWAYTLHKLVEHFNSHGRIRGRRVCLDRRRQWRYAANIWQNAAIRTALYNVTVPARWLWGRANPARKET